MTLLVEGTHLDPRKELPKPSYELLPEAVVDTFTGLGIDIKPFRNFDPELISATTDYAVTVLSEATKRFYALETPVASSDISERYAVCVSEAVDTVDIAPVLEVIETHASTPALTEKYENNFNTIYDSFLIAAKSAVVPAIINLDTAYSVGDVEQLKAYEKTFKPLGFTVEPYIEKVGEPLPPNERIVPKQAVVKTAAILAGGAILMTMNVGPAAAADNGNGNQGHGNGNNNPAVVQVLQADGTVSQETPVTTPSQTTSESQPSPETPPDTAMQPNQDTSQSPASDQQPSVTSNDANTNSAPEATPTVDPGVSAPKAITGKVVTSIDPITGKEVTPNIPAAQTDPNPQDAQLAVDGLTPSIKDGLVKLSDAVQQGNAAPLISSSSDGLAIKPDPTHPDKTKPTVFDADLQAKLGVDLAITKGILLGDAETIAVITTYFASHPTKLDPNLQQALDEVQKLDFTTGKGDLTPGQKAAYIQLSLLMSGEMTATAEAQQAAATDAYNAAQAKAAAEQTAADAKKAADQKAAHETQAKGEISNKLIDSVAQQYNWSSNKTTVLKGLLHLGVPLPAAAGMMGNIKAESGYRANAEEYGNHIGFGYFQWSFGRRTALENAAKAAGVSPANSAFQLTYVIKESKKRSQRDDASKNEWEGLLAIKDPKEAAAYWQWNFERPKAKTTQGIRVGEAQSIYNQVSQALNSRDVNTSGSKAAGSQFPSSIAPGVPYLSQWDNRWADVSYNKSNGDHRTIAQSGCSPTTAAWVLRTLGVDKKETPVDQAKANLRNGGRLSSAVAFSEMAKDNGLHFRNISGLSTSERVAAIQQALSINPDTGRPYGVVVASGQDASASDPAPFTTSGHVLGIYRVKSDGSVKVMDPNSLRKSKVWWDKNQIIGRASFVYILSK